MLRHHRQRHRLLLGNLRHRLNLIHHHCITHLTFPNLLLALSRSNRYLFWCLGFRAIFFSQSSSSVSSSMHFVWLVVRKSATLSLVGSGDMIPFCECYSFTLELARLGGRGVAAFVRTCIASPISSNLHGASCTALRGQLQCYRRLLFYFPSVFQLDWFTDCSYSVLPQTRRIERWRGGEGVPILSSSSKCYFTTVAGVFILRCLIGATFVSCEGHLLRSSRVLREYLCQSY